MVANRPLGVVLRNAVRPANYRALVNMARLYPDFVENARRYFRASGDYPYRCRVRTPIGELAPTLHSWHDMLTVNEVFCRGDYRSPRDVRVVVDVGSNIGISALYFLSRNPRVRAHLYEPVPANVERLRANLSAFSDRYLLEEAAVADAEGTAAFTVEPSGRYGGLDREDGERIEVRCRHAGAVLEEVLEREDFVDVLKIDTEGAEARTLAAIPPPLLSRVGLVYLESEEPGSVELRGFDRSWRCDTLRLVNRSPAPGP